MGTTTPTYRPRTLRATVDEERSREAAARQAPPLAPPRDVMRALQDFAGRFEVRGYVGPAEAIELFYTGFECVNVLVTGYVPDATKAEGAAWILVSLNRRVASDLVVNETSRALLDIIRAALADLTHHEIDEGIHFDGRRPFDPHQ
jgi:hypothetical protein